MDHAVRPARADRGNEGRAAGRDRARLRASLSVRRRQARARRVRPRHRRQPRRARDRSLGDPARPVPGHCPRPACGVFRPPRLHFSPWRTKSEDVTLPPWNSNPANSPSATSKAPSIPSDVTAATLHQAVALALKTLRHTDGSLPQYTYSGYVQVAVQNIPVTHTVKLLAFRKWLDLRGRTPVEITRRQKVRAIL